MGLSWQFPHIILGDFTGDQVPKIFGLIRINRCAY